LGGDEFVVLAAIGSEESADSLIARLQLRFELYNAQSSVPYKLSISVGVVHFDLDEDSIEEVTARADRNMYEDKRRKQTGPLPLEILKPQIDAVT